MLKTLRKSISLLLVCLICISLVNGPVEIKASAAKSEDHIAYTDRSLIKGSMFTDSKALADKLDKAFDGHIGLYKNYGKKEERICKVGTRGVPYDWGDSKITSNNDSSKTYLCKTCISYANALYNFLFGDIPNVLGKNSESKRYSWNSGKANFNSFLKNEICTGTYMSVSNHALVVLKYDDSGIWYVDGNGEEGMDLTGTTKTNGAGGGGLIVVRYMTWNKFNAYTSIKSFVKPSNELYVRLYGISNFKKTDFSKPITYKIAESKASIRKGPYEIYSCVYTKSLGDTVNAVGSYTNIYNNLWYQLDDGNWIYSKRVTQLTNKTVTFNKTSSTQKKVESKIKATTTFTEFPSPMVVTENSSFVIPGPAPKADGYTFLGYSTKEDATSAEYQIGDEVKSSKDLVLYPVWRQTKTTMELGAYDLSFDITNNKKTATVKVKCRGSLDKSYNISVKSEDSYLVTASVSNKEYKNYFLWDELNANVNVTAKSGGDTHLVVSVTDSSGKTLALNTITVRINESYQINYYIDGVKEKSQTKNLFKDIDLLSYIPEKENHKFMGWTTVSGSTTVEYGPGDLYKRNAALNLYAVWEENVRIDAPKWNESTKTLTITGKGDMPCYPSQKTPWLDYASKAENLVIESGITSIGANAFSGFSKLKKVTLRYGIVRISNKAFNNCTALVDINFPASISVIGNKAFSGCSKLPEAIFEKSNVFKAASVDSNSETGIEIGAYAFENCVSLASIDIPDNVTELGAGAFSGCTGLEEVTISEGLETLEDNTFFNCSSIESIDIPDNIVSIGDGTFSGCSSAQEVIIPEGVEEIGDQAFSGCSVLEEVVIPSSVDTIGAGVFSACSMLSDVELPDNLDYVGDAMFSSCFALDSIELPEGLEYIGDGAFRDCSALTEIEIPESVNSINDDTFCGCSSLEEIVLPASINSIGDYAFCYCEELTDVKLNEGLSSIGVCAFAYCSSLETIAIPATVTNIDVGSFVDCASLKNVEILESPVSIGDYAFSGCSALEEIYLPESIVSLGNDVFTDCSASFEVSCFSSSSVYEQVIDSYENTDVFVPVESVALDKEELTIDTEKTETLTCTVYPSNATCKDVTWRSDNEAVATVDDGGIITAVSGGTATITVTSKDGLFVDSCFVTVNVPVEGIEFCYNGENAYIGDEFDLCYLFTPENPTNINTRLTSSNENIAVVNEDGTVRIVGEGTVDITVTAEDGNYSDTCRINCSEYIEVSEIKLDKQEIILSSGETSKINVQFVPENANNKYAELIIEDKNIISVDEDGNIVALKPGTTSLFATNGECDSELCTVTVLENHTHSYSAVITEPTCTEQGYTTYTCSCGDSYKTDFINPTGHVFVSGSFSWSDGHTNCNFILPCSKCSYAEEVECSVIKDLIAPTCVLDGKVIYTATCIYDGKTYKDVYEEKSGDATGHQFINGECQICHVKQEEAALNDAKTLAISELEDAKKNVVSDEAKAALDESIANVKSATSVADVETAKSTGIANAEDADKNLADAKVAAKAELTETKKNVVSDEAKAAIDSAIANVDNATSLNNVASAKSAGLTNAASADKALSDAKEAAINDINSAKSNAKSDEAKAILENAKDAINSATNISTVSVEKANAVFAANTADNAYVEKTKFDKVKINVASEKAIDYRSIVTIKATATDVPEEYKLAIYLGSQKVAEGDNKSVSYEYGELKSDLNYSVKVIDANGKIQKDNSGNDVAKDGGKITCNAGFFKKLIAFFKGLFKSLPKVEVKP